MLKLVRFLTKNYNLVSIILISPLILIFISSGFSLKMVPQDPFPTYDVEISVPGRTASEIENRVTKPAEKIFNSLSGLVSLSSITNPENAHIQLRFDEKIGFTTSFLYIQEKMDQIKLSLPGDVESIKVLKEEIDRPANLKFSFSKPVSLKEINTLLSDYKSSILKAEPEVSNLVEIQVQPYIDRMYKENISLSSIFTTLRLNGLTASLGSKKGVLYEKSRGFEFIEELKANVVGMKEHRPIRLVDVADINLVANASTKEFSLWFDESNVTKSEIENLLQPLDDKLQITSPYFRAIIHQSIEPVLGILLVIFLQLIVLRKVFGQKMPWFNLMLYNSFVAIHFLFWKGVIYSELTVIDLHSLLLNLIIGGGFWILLFSRMRSYFLQESKIKKIPKTTEQVILFSIIETVPTLMVLILCFWVMNFGISATSFNIPSRNLLETFFSFGAPIMLLLLVVMPVLIHPKRLKDCLDLPKHIPNWNISNRTNQVIIWSVLIFGIGSAFLFNELGVGVNSRFESRKQIGNKLMDQLRGYAGKWEYAWEYTQSSELPATVDVMAQEKQSLRAEWQFTPLGLSFLPELDILGFKEALKSLDTVISYIEINSNRIPIKLLAFKEDGLEFGKLLLSGKKKDVESKPIKLLTEKTIENQQTGLLHDKMLKIRKVTNKEDDLKIKPKNLGATQWTEFLQQQLNQFSGKQFMSILFVFLILAIFLNSFVRSFLLVLFAMATSSSLFIFNVLLGRTWNVDSLWMLHLLPLLCISIILVPSKLCDIERSRGHDRDDIVEDVRQQFSPSVFYVFVYWACCFFIMGSSEWIPTLASLGLWYEANIIAIIMLITGYISYRYLFPIYYLDSEEALDNLAYKLYSILYLKGWFKGK